MSELKALEALLQNYNANHQKLYAELKPVFANEGNFLEKVNAMDAILGGYTDFAAVTEYVFDLLMVHHLANYIEGEEYLESDEWTEIEEKTLDRGTELLNVLLYISESNEDDVQVGIDDFLYEFLLVDDDEFQDEHRIYEYLIVNQDLVEEDLENVIRISSQIPGDSELKNLFTPLILFFRNPAERTIGRDVYNKLGAEERALLGCMLAYKN